MLRVARSESGTIELRFERVGLRAVCASAIEAFEGATKRKDVVIRLEPGEEVFIDGDGEWLRQIVEGMIDNALRYAKGASVISLQGGPEDGQASPEDLLDRFARRGAIDDVSGHGIGLALVRWVVDKHKGSVTLRKADAPLNGAEVLIRLPLAKA